MTGKLIVLTLALISFHLGTAKEVVKASCLKGPYHSKVPTAVSKAKLKVCEAWNATACCTPEFTGELSSTQTEKLYNFTWHRCGRLSKSCESYWYHEECFYQCSPYIHQWKHPTKMGVVVGVPVCASYCDRWYEACKNDLICVPNVLTDFNFTIHGHNFCPKGKPCITYERMYGGGKALCEKMWGDAFVYKKENKDSSNCMVMTFSGLNPNRLVKKPYNIGVRSNDVGVVVLVVALLTTFLVDKITIQ